MRGGRVFRIAALTLFTLVSITSLLLAIQRLALPLLAWLLPAYESFCYDLGAWGVYPTTRYVTFNGTVPRGHMVQWDDSCDDDGLVFIAPFGKSVERPGPMILDARGELVWASHEFQTAADFNVQTFEGERFLTFWSGDRHGGPGSGAVVMLDSHYEVNRTIRAVGSHLRTDLHEFVVTEDGHALITTVNETTADLRPLGWFRGEDAPIENSVFQDLDIATGELVFQWSASDYFKPEDSYFWDPIAGYIPSLPYDFSHLNSVQKDSRGNYLVSIRHLHRILYLDGRSGEILWTLGGGAASDFTDISPSGQTAEFHWQHHARWQSEEDGILSLFDNGNTRYQYTTPHSRALLLHLDRENFTVRHLHSYSSRDQGRSVSQGSVQILNDDRVFVGWGSMAAWSEFQLDSEALLCEYHFAPRWTFWWERVKNYRALKIPGWRGEPRGLPVARRRGGRVFVSWNGATGVKFWRLERDGGEVGEVIEKKGFESSFRVSSSPGKFRVAALDAGMSVLATSEVAEEVAEEGEGGLLVGVFSGVGVVVVVLVVVLRRRRRQAGQQLQTSSWEMPAWDRYKYSRLGEDLT